MNAETLEMYSSNLPNWPTPPIHTIHLGFVKASIWKHPTSVGIRHRVAVCRLFKNGDVWEQSGRFGLDDLPLVTKVIALAHAWICFQSKEDDAEGGL
jgi:hypothetical protein